MTPTRLLALTVALILAASSAMAYTADIRLDVQDTGLVTITGTSDHPVLTQGTTHDHTSKRGRYWLLNITTHDALDTYAVELDFPPDTEVNYIRLSGTMHVLQGDGLHFRTTGENETFRAVVQYRIHHQAASAAWMFFVVWGIIALAIIVVLAVGGRVYNKRKKTSGKKSKLAIVRHALTENQNTIVDILLEAKQPVTQKQILHRTKLPKSTLSHNLRVMERKGVIVKQSRGMMNVIRINEHILE